MGDGGGRVETPDLSVVIPVYNEAHRIAVTVATVERWLRTRRADGSLSTAEIVVVSDGSRDDPGRRFPTGHRDGIDVRLVELPENRGKGAAVRAGILEARGARILFSDADLATPIEEAARLEAALDDGADIAIASRRRADSDVQVAQTPVRRLSGRVFPRLVRALTGLSHADTQCGFKLFRAEAARAVFEGLQEERFGFDVELLCAAREQELEVAEVGVLWRDSGETTVHILRDPLRMAATLVRLSDPRRFPHVFSRQLGIAALGALLLLALARGAFTGVPPLYDTSEGRDGSIALHIHETGEWLVPLVPEDGEWRVEIDRPPLADWLTAASFRVFGVHEFAARFPSYIQGLMLLALVFRTARLFGGRNLGALAALVLGSSLLFLALWGTVITDMTASFCVAGVVMSGMIGRHQIGPAGRPWRIAMFVFLGLGWLAVGMPILVLGLVPLLAPIILSGRFRELLRFRWFAGGAIVAVIVLPWAIAVERAHPGAWRSMSSFRGAGEVSATSLWLTWIAGLMPWPLLFLAGGQDALAATLRRFRHLDTPEWSLLAAALAPPLLWSATGAAAPTQVLPAFAPAALLLAIGIRESLLIAAAPRSRLVLLSAAPLLVVLAMLLLPALRPEIFSPASGAIAVSAVLVVLLLVAMRRPHELTAIGFLPLAIIGAVFAFWTTAAPTVNERDSGRALMEAARSLLDGREGPIVVLRRGADSIEFYGQGELVWIDDLADPALLARIGDDVPEVYLLRNRYREWLTPELRAGLTRVSSVGRFDLYRDTAPVVALPGSGPPGRS